MSLSRRRLRVRWPAILPIWALRAGLPAAETGTQEKEKPSADPTTVAVAMSESAKDRQLLGKGSSMAQCPSNRQSGGLTRTARTKVTQPPSGIGPKRYWIG